MPSSYSMVRLLIFTSLFGSAVAGFAQEYRKGQPTAPPSTPVYTAPAETPKPPLEPIPAKPAPIEAEPSPVLNTQPEMFPITLELLRVNGRPIENARLTIPELGLAEVLLDPSKPYRFTLAKGEQVEVVIRSANHKPERLVLKAKPQDVRVYLKKKGFFKRVFGKKDKPEKESSPEGAAPKPAT